VRESNASGVVFLSGDVHFGEVAEAGGGCALDYPVLDVTSSGMTHTVMGFLGKLPLPAINPLTLFKRHLPPYMVRVPPDLSSLGMCGEIRGAALRAALGRSGGTGATRIGGQRRYVITGSGLDSFFPTAGLGVAVQVSPAAVRATQLR